MSKPRLLFHSNSPWSSTGYGQQTGVFCPLLAEHYDLQISSFYGLEGAPLKWNGVRVLPSMGGTFGNESLPQHALRFFKGDPRGGLVVTLMDVWVLDPGMCARLNMACWVPVDHDPVPPGVLGFLENSQAVPIAMSRFGQERLGKLDALYVPHGIDTETFRPFDQAKARELLGFDLEPDAFLVGMVAANKGNPSRKSFVAALEAFAQFQRRHENAFLYLHTDMTGEGSQGVHLPSLIDALGIPAERLRWADPYAIHYAPMSGEGMACVYSAMDVLLNPSMGEGFGIPVLEAQATGTPAIVTEFSAMREVCGAGWHIEGVKTWTGQRSWQMTPKVGDILEALNHAYQLPTASRDQLSQRARAHALQYDAKLVLREHMLPELRAARDRLEARKPMVIRPHNRARKVAA